MKLSETKRTATQIAFGGKKDEATIWFFFDGIMNKIETGKLNHYFNHYFTHRKYLRAQPPIPAKNVQRLVNLISNEINPKMSTLYTNSLKAPLEYKKNLF